MKDGDSYSGGPSTSYPAGSHGWTMARAHEQHVESQQKIWAEINGQTSTASPTSTAASGRQPSHDMSVLEIILTSIMALITGALGLGALGVLVVMILMARQCANS